MVLRLHGDKFLGVIIGNHLDVIPCSQDHLRIHDPLQVLFGQFFFQIPKRLTNDRLDLVHADILSKETVEVLDGDERSTLPVSSRLLPNNLKISSAYSRRSPSLRARQAPTNSE